MFIVEGSGYLANKSASDLNCVSLGTTCHVKRPDLYSISFRVKDSIGKAEYVQTGHSLLLLQGVTQPYSSPPVPAHPSGIKQQFAHYLGYR